MTDEDALATFDFAAFFAAIDDARRDRKMRWGELADELWDQSAQLNAQREDHPLCGGAVSRLGARGETSCQYALYRLRWDLAQLHAALNEERQRQGLTWAGLAGQVGCTPSRLTNLRTARMADL